MPLIIADGKGTPQNHTFTQDAQQNGADPAEFVNRGNANGPSFWERLVSLVTLGKKATVPHVIKVTMTRPIAGTVNGNPAVLGLHKAHLTLLVDQSVATEADVLDSLVLMGNLCDNATFRGQVKQFAPTLIP